MGDAALLGKTGDRSAAALEPKLVRAVFERLGAKPALESGTRLLDALK